LSIVVVALGSKAPYKNAFQLTDILFTATE